MNKSSLFGTIALILISVFTQSDGAERMGFGFEGKYSTTKIHGSNPFGLGGNVSFKLDETKFYWGFDLGMEIVSSWVDTMDLASTGEPSDTALYDIWTREGTDAFFALGGIFKRTILSKGKLSFDGCIGAGVLLHFSSYDDLKEAFNPPPRLAKSVTSTETDLYLKPRLSVALGRIYIAYEYYLFSDNLGHTFCAGIGF